MTQAAFDTAADAPYFADVADGPPGARTFWAEPPGARIRLCHWPSAAPARGTVLIFPGRAEFIEKYGPVAARFAAEGLHVVAVDWRGQGLSDRPLEDRRIGHVERFEDYQRDADALFGLAKTLPGPHFMLAHSMGGAIGLRALIRGLPVRAAAFSAPMWGLTMAPHLHPLAWGISTAARHLKLSGRPAPGRAKRSPIEDAAFEMNALTTDRVQWDRMQAQLRAHPDLALTGPSLGWLYEALHEMRALRRAPAPNVPAWCGIGSNERIVSPAAVEERMEGWGELTRFDGAEHELLMERPAIREAALGKILERFA